MAKKISTKKVMVAKLVLYGSAFLGVILAFKIIPQYETLFIEEGFGYLVWLPAFAVIVGFIGIGLHVAQRILESTKQ